MKKISSLAMVLFLLAQVSWSQPADSTQSKGKAEPATSTPKIKDKASENKPAGSGEKLISMSELLKGASDEAKKEFLDGMMIVDGKIASVRTKLLKRDLGEPRVQAILLALNPHSGKVYKLSGPLHTLALCGQHYCSDTACNSDSSGHKTCVDYNGSECYSNCQ